MSKFLSVLLPILLHAGAARADVIIAASGSAESCSFWNTECFRSFTEARARMEEDAVLRCRQRGFTRAEPVSEPQCRYQRTGQRERTDCLGAFRCGG